MKRLTLLIVLLVFAALGAFVWPTRYRFDHITIDGDNYLIRIHRFSGRAEILVPEQGWTPAEDSWDESPPPADGGRS
jgi:hypothetical protein